jgi:hypothetical protein
VKDHGTDSSRTAKPGLDTLAYTNVRNVGRNMHKARYSQLLAVPTDNEETREALGAV